MLLRRLSVRIDTTKPFVLFGHAGLPGKIYRT